MKKIATILGIMVVMAGVGVYYVYNHDNNIFNSKYYSIEAVVRNINDINEVEEKMAEIQKQINRLEDIDMERDAKNNLIRWHRNKIKNTLHASMLTIDRYKNGEKQYYFKTDFAALDNKIIQLEKVILKKSSIYY